MRETSLSDNRTNLEDLLRIKSINSNIKPLDPTIIYDKEKDSNQHFKIIGNSHFQSGVLRTNCIDCLDRTNIAQYAYGLAALGRQLHAMSLTSLQKLDSESSIAIRLMNMYQEMGDALAFQYGGSAAHTTVFAERQGKWKATTQSREFLKSIKRYYSNTYTDGEKQDAMNLFLGYFQPQEGKPALWDLDCDYYLHVTGVGFDLTPDPDENPTNAQTEESGNAFASLPSEEILRNFAPIPACKQDFSLMKLTSFDRLLETTGSFLTNVRLFSEQDVKSIGMPGNSGMAPDAAAVQLKSPNWLFGQRKQGECVPATNKTTSNEKGQFEGDSIIDAYLDPSLLSIDEHEDDIFQRYLKITSASDDKSWYGESLLYGQDKSSKVYKHYAELCQGPAMEPFEPDPEKENHYRAALSMGMDESYDRTVEEEMASALKMYDQIGADLGIGVGCKALAADTCQLTRWIIGEERVRTSKE